MGDYMYGVVISEVSTESGFGSKPSACLPDSPILLAEPRHRLRFSARSGSTLRNYSPCTRMEVAANRLIWRWFFMVLRNKTTQARCSHIGGGMAVVGGCPGYEGSGPCCRTEQRQQNLYDAVTNANCVCHQCRSESNTHRGSLAFQTFSLGGPVVISRYGSGTKTVCGA